jgi:hypothetical protein
MIIRRAGPPYGSLLLRRGSLSDLGCHAPKVRDPSAGDAAGATKEIGAFGQQLSGNVSSITKLSDRPTAIGETETHCRVGYWASMRSMPGSRGIRCPARQTTPRPRPPAK